MPQKYSASSLMISALRPWKFLFGSSYLVHYLHPTVTKTLSQLTKQSWLLLIWICVTVFNNWKLSMVDSKQMITVWLSVNFIFFSWRELKVICRKLCLDEHSKIQISYMLLFEIGGFWHRLYCCCANKKKKQATNDLIFFSSNIIQRADLEWLIKATGL